MRAFLSSILAAGAALFLVAPAASAAPATRLKIDASTSAIYQYDPSPMGLGTLYDTVRVKAQLRNCAPGYYMLSITLVQDGVSYPWASTALGAGEIVCTGSGVTQTGMSFYGNGLHPGTATVTITIYRQQDGMPVAVEGSRTVRIPAGYHQP